MINENIRHSASYELSDIQLGRCIDALRDLLQDSKCLLHDQHAQAAVNKLNQVVPVSKSMKILPVWSAACLNCTVTGDICRYLWSLWLFSCVFLCKFRPSKRGGGLVLWTTALKAFSFVSQSETYYYVPTKSWLIISKEILFKLLLQRILVFISCLHVNNAYLC
jgi:hypothetical protein